MINSVCANCLHYDVCLLHEDNFIDDVAKNGFCGKFKNKADFVEVVRCEKCTRRVDYQGRIMCNLFGHKFENEWYGLKATTKDHFCSYGKRK